LDTQEFWFFYFGYPSIDINGVYFGNDVAAGWVDISVFGGMNLCDVVMV